MTVTISIEDYITLVSFFYLYDESKVYSKKDGLDKFIESLSEKYPIVRYAMTREDNIGKIEIVKTPYKTMIIESDLVLNYYIYTFYKKKMVKKINNVVEKYEIILNNLELINKTL